MTTPPDTPRDDRPPAEAMIADLQATARREVWGARAALAALALSVGLIGVVVFGFVRDAETRGALDIVRTDLCGRPVPTPDRDAACRNVRANIRTACSPEVLAAEPPATRDRERAKCAAVTPADRG